MDLIQIDDITVSNAELHELSHTHPRMNESQFEALKDSLYLDGQQQPVITYRGKIIDGRHRIWAMTDLGVESAKAVELPRNTKMAEVKSFVRTSETRRHQTKTQLACHAYLSLINPKTEVKTAAQAAREFGIKQKDISHCKFIAENLGINIIESFSKGNVERVAVQGVFFNFSSARALYDALKRVKKDFIVKKPVQNASFSWAEERAKTQKHHANDSNELVVAKIQLLQEYYNGRFEE